jgi:hypothetical protein
VATPVLELLKPRGEILIKDFDDLKPSLVGVQTPGYGGADKTSTSNGGNKNNKKAKTTKKNIGILIN